MSIGVASSRYGPTIWMPTPEILLPRLACFPLPALHLQEHSVRCRERLREDRIARAIRVLRLANDPTQTWSGGLRPRRWRACRDAAPADFTFASAI